MGQLSRVLRSIAGGGLGFWCPGCREMHVVWTGDGSGPRWGWNGNVERPTFTPSVLVRGTQTVRDENGRWTGDWVLDAAGNALPRVCHTFVTDGRIQFLGDCTHALAGQTVDLPDVPAMRHREGGD